VIRGRVRHALAWRLQALVGRLDALSAQSGTIQQRLDRIDSRLAELGVTVDELRANAAALPQAAGDAAAVREAIDERLHPMLRVLVDHEAENRRALYALRCDPDYEAAFLDPDPLVSVVIATAGRPELVTRTLPSLLSQSHANLEVLIVGDDTPPEFELAIRELGDPRIEFRNLTQRLRAHADGWHSWLVASTMPRNEAARLARGQWLLHFDDDDSLRPDSIARLLAVARERRAEVAYGGFEQHDPDCRGAHPPVFPPRWGAFAWPAALVHGGLRFFERELVAAHLDLPGDMYMLTRMLRVGVRFAMLDDVLLDYFPSTQRQQHADAAERPSVVASLAYGRSPLADAVEVRATRAAGRGGAAAPPPAPRPL
jgi:hypothetical protein